MKFNWDCLKWLEDRVVRINRGGPESKKGRLVAVKDDHLVLLGEDQYLYYPTHHVKSVTVNTFDHVANTVQSDKQIPAYLDFNSFHDVLKKMGNRRVQINQGGPECISGILSQTFDDHIDLVREYEVIKVASFHINNISYDLNKQSESSQNEATSENDGGVKKEAEQPQETAVQPEERELQPEAAVAKRKGRRQIFFTTKKKRWKNAKKTRMEATFYVMNPKKTLRSKKQRLSKSGVLSSVWLAKGIRKNFVA